MSEKEVANQVLMLVASLVTAIRSAIVLLEEDAGARKVLEEALRVAGNAIG